MLAFQAAEAAFPKTGVYILLAFILLGTAAAVWKHYADLPKEQSTKGKKKSSGGANTNRRAPQTWDFTYKGQAHDYLLAPVNGAKTEKFLLGYGGGNIDSDDYMLFLVNGQTVRYRILGIQWSDYPFRSFAAWIEEAPRDGEKKGGGGGGGGGRDRGRSGGDDD